MIILFFCNDTATTEIYTYGHTLSLHDALPISVVFAGGHDRERPVAGLEDDDGRHQGGRSEEHTSELQSLMRISYAVFCLKKKHKHLFSLFIFLYSTHSELISILLFLHYFTLAHCLYYSHFFLYTFISSS